MENSSLLQIEALSVTVGSKVLVNNISITLNAGKTLCLVGESGSGKTTTALACMGLLSYKRGFKATGKVLYNNTNLLEFTDKEWQKVRGPELAMIFQDPSSSLNPIFSIGDQIREMLEIHTDYSDDELDVKTLEVLAKVGLQSLHNPFAIYPHELSGGMKQRVMIAMNICLKPKLLIADEPTSALDLTVQKDILKLLKKFDGAMLLITHDFGVVAEMADDVAVMYKGEIVEHNTVHEIFTNPQAPYTKALLASRPTKENRRQMLPVVSI
ncbi:MAG: ABC transporter ATP-binding protein [Chlamydiales bacterium]|nr:ABC transporter ATP-binding protein [Chlamydiales bacterium]